MSQCPNRYYEEALQSLFKLQLPTIWDGRDLLLDGIGITAGYIIGAPQ